ncbi:hypothetical protein FA15DRAFT_653422 [Coprinopsis marcescibilis]|uniref:Uncharacterized protein n=1 Tax=Coprinopsis marcescibilis TaxID=230819 RepID=A0A5C3L403_COPMA|nr:hypothetical protein FA15DRAFT_653422 [Coprinopsis marcescibilis]
MWVDIQFTLRWDRWDFRRHLSYATSLPFCVPTVKLRTRTRRFTSRAKYVYASLLLKALLNEWQLPSALCDVFQCLLGIFPFLWPGCVVAFLEICVRDLHSGGLCRRWWPPRGAGMGMLAEGLERVHEARVRYLLPKGVVGCWERGRTDGLLTELAPRGPLQGFGYRSAAHCCAGFPMLKWRPWFLRRDRQSTATRRRLLFWLLPVRQYQPSQTGFCLCKKDSDARYNDEVNDERKHCFNSSGHLNGHYSTGTLRFLPESQPTPMLVKRNEMNETKILLDVWPAMCLHSETNGWIATYLPMAIVLAPDLLDECGVKTLFESYAGNPRSKRE